MLKEIAIFAVIFIISIAIFILPRSSTSGLVLLPTDIFFGFVIGLVGFFIVATFLILPGRKKEEGKPKTIGEIALELDGPINLVKHLYQDFAYRFKGTSDYIERKKLEKTRDYLSKILNYLKRAQEHFTKGEYGIPELEQAVSEAGKFPYGVDTSRGNVKISIYMSALLKKVRDLYTEHD